MHVVRKIFKIWMLSGTLFTLPRGHPDMWGRINMNKMLDLSGARCSLKVGLLAADICTAYLSMLEIHNIQKV